MGRPRFWRNFDFFCVFGRFGGPGDLCFFGDPTPAKNAKKSDLGPVEAVSGKFSGDLKVALGDSATDEPKKSEF